MHKKIYSFPNSPCQISLHYLHPIFLTFLFQNVFIKFRSKIVLPSLRCIVLLIGYSISHIELPAKTFERKPGAEERRGKDALHHTSPVLLKRTKSLKSNKRPKRKKRKKYVLHKDDNRAHKIHTNTHKHAHARTLPRILTSTKNKKKKEKQYIYIFIFFSPTIDWYYTFNDFWNFNIILLCSMYFYLFINYFFLFFAFPFYKTTYTQIHTNIRTHVACNDWPKRTGLDVLSCAWLGKTIDWPNMKKRLQNTHQPENQVNGRYDYTNKVCKSEPSKRGILVLYYPLPVVEESERERRE